MNESAYPDGGNGMSRRAVVGLAMVSLALLTVACFGLGGTNKSLVGEPAPAFAVQYQSRTVTLEDPGDCAEHDCVGRDGFACPE